jgi:hypothetical protein
LGSKKPKQQCNGGPVGQQPQRGDSVKQRKQHVSRSISRKNFVRIIEKNRKTFGFSDY